MTTDDLNQYLMTLKISRDRILQEEAEMIFLDYLAKDRISNSLLFYGGTALRLAYNSPRFSEDVDLLVIKTLKFVDFKKFINLVISKQVNWSLKDLKDKRQTMFALILINDDKLKNNFSLKIEIHKPVKRIKLENQLTLIKSPVSFLEPLLLVPTLSELKKLKELALLGRQKGRDIFDLWYISRVLRQEFKLPAKLPIYKEKEFKNELQVFLPTKYYPVIQELYEQIRARNKKN